MNPAIVTAIETAIFAIAAFANYTVLQSINYKVSELNGTLREWARSNFAEKALVQQLEERLRHVEMRRGPATTE